MAAIINADSAIPPNVSEITGATFFGALINWFLFGVLMLQAYHYYVTFHASDRFRVQAIVYLTLILESLQTALLTRDAYLTYVARWGDPDILLLQGYAFVYIPILGALLSFIVQIFYAWRLYILTKRTWLSCVISLVSATQMVAGMVAGIRSSSIELTTEIVAHTTTTVSLWLAGSALADVIIASAMVITLMRSRTGFKRTDTLISRIVQLTLETGLLCAAVAVTDLTFFLVIPKNWHICIAEVLSKLYTNSLLVVLNSRSAIKSTLASGENLNSNSRTGDRIYFRSLDGHSTPLSTPTSPRTPQTIAVAVHREVLKDPQLRVEIPMHHISPPGYL